MHYFKPCLFSAIIAVVFISPLEIFAQQAPAIQWQRIYGGFGDDDALSLVQVNEDNYVFAGYTSSNDGDIKGFHIGIAGSNNYNSDAWIVSMDQAGIIWQACLGGSENDAANCIVKTSDGGFAVAGYTASSDGDVVNNPTPGVSQAWIIKLDQYGHVVWQKVLGGSYARAFSIIETKDEGRDLVVTGSVSGTKFSDGQVSGNHGEDDVWVVRLSSEGDVRWQKCFGGSKQDVGMTIIQTTDQGFAIAGSTKSHDGDVAGHHADSIANFDEWVIKLDRNGNLEWQKCLGGGGDELFPFEGGTGITQTLDGGYTLATYTRSNDGDVSGFYEVKDAIFNTFHPNAWMVKLSSSGVLQWQKCFGEGEMRTIIQESNGDYIFDLSDSVLGIATLIARSDSIGLIKWQAKISRGISIGSFSVIKSLDGGYAYAGISKDTIGFGWRDNALVVKLNPDSPKAFIAEKIDRMNDIKFYPNPSSSEIHFQIASNHSMKGIKFYDMMGREVFPGFRIENNIVTCDVHQFPSGIYQAHLDWQSENASGSYMIPFVVQH
jgi:hypothetical protein